MKQKVKLKEVALYSKGQQINGDELLEEGSYAYLNGGINPSGKWHSYNVEGKTVTVSEGGNSSGYVNYMEQPFWCGAHCYYLFDVIGEMKYIYYALKSQQDRIMKIRSGACMPNIKKDDLGNFEFLFDNDLGVQNQIIRVLDKISYIISRHQQQLFNLDTLITSRFVEMFGDPVENPKGWKKKQLQEIVSADCTISYGIVQTGEDKEVGIPVFRPVDIVNRVPKLEELKKTTVEISNKYKKTLLKGREMLITVRANIADTFIVGKEFEGCNVGRGIVPIRVQEDVIILEFLKYQLDNKHLNDTIKRLAKGITLLQLNMEDLRMVELIIPPIEKQKAFVMFAKQVEKLEAVAQKRLEETQFLFDSLMQQYFG